MGLDTRAAVIVFLFYLLNGLTSLASNRIFLPPLFAEAWLLGGISLLYFILSIRSVFSVLFLAMAFYSFYGIYNPVLPETEPTLLQKMVLWIPLLLPVVLYVRISIGFGSEKKRGQILWIIHMVCFLVSLVPVWLNNTAVVSLVAGIIQSFAGIVMLSNDEVGLSQKNWEKKIVLTMILIVFFDTAAYLYFMSLPSAWSSDSAF